MNASPRVAYLARRFRGFVQRKAPLMITCRELEAFILDYLDGALSPKERVVFRLPLLLCRECRDYLARYRRAIEAGRIAFAHPDDVPEDVPDALVRAVLAARRASLGE